MGRRDFQSTVADSLPRIIQEHAKTGIGSIKFSKKDKKSVGKLYFRGGAIYAIELSTYTPNIVNRIATNEYISERSREALLTKFEHNITSLDAINYVLTYQLFPEKPLLTYIKDYFLDAFDILYAWEGVNVEWRTNDEPAPSIPTVPNANPYELIQKLIKRQQFLAHEVGQTWGVSADEIENLTFKKNFDYSDPDYITNVILTLLADGQWTIGNVASYLGLSHFNTKVMIYDLWKEGIVDVTTPSGKVITNTVSAVTSNPTVSNKTITVPAIEAENHATTVEPVIEEEAPSDDEEPRPEENVDKPTDLEVANAEEFPESSVPESNYVEPETEQNEEPNEFVEEITEYSPEPQKIEEQEEVSIIEVESLYDLIKSYAGDETEKQTSTVEVPEIPVEKTEPMSSEEIETTDEASSNNDIVLAEEAGASSTDESISDESIEISDEVPVEDEEEETLVTSNTQSENLEDTEVEENLKETLSESLEEPESVASIPVNSPMVPTTIEKPIILEPKPVALIKPTNTPIVKENIMPETPTSGISSRIREIARQLQQELSNLSHTIEETKSAKAGYEVEWSSLNEQRNDLLNQLSIVDGRLAEQAQKINESNTKLSELESDYQDSVQLAQGIL